MVDAGHGGTDPGTQGVSKSPEKSITLAIAKELATKLDQHGAHVTMTRTKDVFIELDRRAATADKTKADLLVSVHADSHEDRSIAGATVSVDSEEAYTGESVEPAVTVTLGSKTLVEGTDYTVSYADNVEVGTATVTVTGTGDYAGVSKANFQIESGTTLIQRACNTATTAASSSSLSSGVTI